MPAKAKPKSKLKTRPKQKKRSIAEARPVAPKIKAEKPHFSVSAILEALEDENILPLEIIDDEIIEPDETLLAQQDEDIDDILPVHSHEIAIELSEDPVRLYLREIGQVKLLDSDSEFRLATISEADRHITKLRKLKQRKGVSLASSIYHAVLLELATSWDRLIEDTKQLDHELPNLALDDRRSPVASLGLAI